MEYEPTVAANVYVFTFGLLDFIAEHGDGKNKLFTHLSELLLQIQSAMEQILQRETSNYPLDNALCTLKKVLELLNADLHMYRESRTHRLLSAFHPLMLSGRLKEDRHLLAEEFRHVQAAIQIIEEVKGYHYIFPPLVDDCISSIEKKNLKSLQKMKTSRVVDTSLFEVKKFWDLYLGDEFEEVESTDFIKALSIWLDEDIKDLALKRLLLRLDENNSQWIMFEDFQDFLRNGNMRETLFSYMSDPPIPLLVWIDENILANATKVLHTVQTGVTIVQLPSIPAAKEWIEANIGFLKKYDSPSQIRYVIEQVFSEPKPAPSKTRTLNTSAGFELTRYIRDKRGLKAPLLVHTSRQYIHATRYVRSFEMTGALAGNYPVFQAYVAALAARRKDDTRWMGYS